MTKKRLVLITGLVLLIAGGAGFAFLRPQPAVPTGEQPVVAPPSTPPKVEAPQRLRLIGSGDMLPHDSVNQQAKTAAGYDYKPFFSEVQKYYQAADVRFCNQEAVSAPGFGVTGYPAFNAPAQFAQDISAVGCNVISLANNHANDKGQQGIDQTLDVWAAIKPLAIAGANRNEAEQKQVRYFSVKGVTFAFVAYTEISNSNNYTPYGLNMLNESLVTTQLTEARTKADIVLVSVHWGTEYSSEVSPAQDRWAALFARHGADVVLGHGPHVLQPVKRLARPAGGETLVYFSLGNMLSTQLDTESLIGGFAVVDVDPTTKKITANSFLPTYMHYEWTAAQKAREELLARTNLKIYPLDQAAPALSRSQAQTTVEAQTARITALMNRFTKTTLLKSSEY